VLVVDDVRTTGATLAAARRALASLPVDVETLAIIGVDDAGAGRLRCLEDRSEREIMAQESKQPCR
jgi:adenine/guanine phosphoribosyltransferase-like PRPP-binding protein